MATAMSKKTNPSLKDIVCALWVGGLIVIAASAYAGHLSGDDTFIYMRYVDNFLHQKGFVYNAGEQSHGVTSSLWPLLMTPLCFLFGNTAVLWKITSTLLTGGAASLLFLTLRRKGIRIAWAVILTVLVLCEPHNFRWNASGMENGLVLFVMSLLVLFWQRIQESAQHALTSRTAEIGLGFFAGTLPFVRPELALFSFGIAGYSAVRNFQTPPRRWTFVVSYVTAGAIFAFITWALFGSLIPQTAEAKAFFLKQADPFYGIIKIGLLILSGSAGFLLVMFTAKSTTRDICVWRIITMLSLFSLIGYLSWVNQIISSRYASYLNLPIMLTAFLLIADRLSSGRNPTRWITCCLGIQILLTGFVLYKVFPVTRISEDAEIKKVAEYLTVNTRHDARIALSEIGALGFYSKRYIIDLFGLTDTATLAWKNEHGRPETQEHLEMLLIARQATHYIDTSASESFLDGQYVRFEPIGEFWVRRNIYFQGRYVEGLWRIYKVTQ